MRKLVVCLAALLAGPAMWMTSTMTTDANAAARSNAPRSVSRSFSRPVSHNVSHATNRVVTHTNRITTHNVTNKRVTTHNLTNRRVTTHNVTNRRVTTNKNVTKHVTKHTTTHATTRRATHTTSTTRKTVHVTHHNLTHAASIIKPKKVAHDPKHKVGKLGNAHNHKPLVVWHKGHFYKRFYYTVLIGGVATWFWYDDVLPDDDGYVASLAEVPTCDDDYSDDCGVRPVPARAKAVPAAARRGCLVSVYDDKDFNGDVWTTSADQPDLGDKWSSRISSIQVIAGTWDFFIDPKYENDKLTLDNGSYPYVGDDWNQQINSFKCVPAQ